MPEMRLLEVQISVRATFRYENTAGGEDSKKVARGGV